ncbi:MAG: fasciclin domain-containing protein [Deltaproteobacteria bacterium]|nr:fasciclin domain-containing protein [Deltaproteobacteria bacterium]
MFLALAVGTTACKKKEADAPAPAPEAAKPTEPAAPATPPAAPPATPPAAEPPKAAEPVAATKNIVEVATEAGSFKTLLTAVEAAGLVDTLKGPGPFTVFAPTDDAFAKIPPDALKALLADKAALTAVLTYHVVPGAVMAKDVATMKSAKTVQGDEVAIDTSNGVKIGGATVIKADIVASNGVIHVIDTVLMPPKK